MSAEVLREAAGLIRQRAEAATPPPWSATIWGVRRGSTGAVVAPFDGNHPDMADRLHIASWHPAVALAVADWLDATANGLDHMLAMSELPTLADGHPAFAVARAYLAPSRPAAAETAERAGRGTT